MTSLYENGYANIHRGVYDLSASATERYEAVRTAVKNFIAASTEEEIIFTRGCTEAINLVAYSWGLSRLNPSDEVLTTTLEHHSNFVPWQHVCGIRGASFRCVELQDDGRIDLDDLRKKLSPRTKLFAVSHLSNALGIQTPIAEVVAMVREHSDALILLDASQSAAHQALDVQELGVDFVAFSGHKIYGPSGVGVLYGRRSLLEEMPPFLCGGDMIRSVRVEGTEFADLPAKFEAGTPPIASVIGLGAALEYLEQISFDAIQAHETHMMRLLEDTLGKIPGLNMLGPDGGRKGLVTFMLDSVHPHDLAQFLASKNVAVRAGHHCAQPLMDHLGVNSTTRASLGIYSTPEDISRLGQALEESLAFFTRKAK
jgi:cysteine desulfurase/selenocysteine lyase